jgi:hypothetical protein
LQAYGRRKHGRWSFLVERHGNCFI